MSYSIEKKNEVLNLRAKGLSIKELAQGMGMSKATISAWVKGMVLDEHAQQRLRQRRILGHYRTIETKRKKRDLLLKSYDESAHKTLAHINTTKDLKKLFCSIFFWTEGGKHTDTHVYFMNSDPVMVETFLNLFRSAFEIDLRKMRALIHIHEYHDEAEIKEFWVSKTGIPLSQFTKSYLKPHTRIRIREGYKGCINVRYYDSRIALELRSLYNAFAEDIISLGA